MNQLSIVVPHLGSSPEFETTLASVLRSSPGCARVIAVTDDRYRDPHEIGTAVDWIGMSHRHWIRRFNEAIETIDTPWSLLLSPGFQLDDDWFEKVRDRMSDDVGAVAPSIVEDAPTSGAVTAGVLINKDGSLRPVNHLWGRDAGPNVEAPTICAAIWRTTLLKSLAPWDDTWTFPELGVDLAHAIRSRRLTAAHVADWNVLVDDSSSVFSVFARPHGRAIERSLRRHAARSRGRSSGLASRLASDLVRAPVQPWRLAQAVQRLTARKFRRADRIFRQRALLDPAVAELSSHTSRKLTKAA